MASITKYKMNGYDCYKLVDASVGRRLQYAIKIDKFTERQWLAAHDNVMKCLSPEDRQDLTSKKLKETVFMWLNTPKESKTNAKLTGINVKGLGIEAKGETSIRKVAQSYLSDFCQPEINSQTAISRAERQCRIVLSFLEGNKVVFYSQLKRDVIKKYPEWRSGSAADTINQELRRLGAIIRYGVKYCEWKERYLLDGMKVKATTENTKAIRPFDIPEVKAILSWLMANAEITGNWYLHDMALLSVCTGLEAKALSLLTPEWFKWDLGILRVYDNWLAAL